LVAQAFVFGAQAELFKQFLKTAENLIDTDVIKLWELRGSIEKLHYIVVWILRTPQRRKQFEKDDKFCNPQTLKPKRENSTRWNFCYQMIKRALVLRAQIQ
jgi:hypothetical protein